MKTVGVVLDEYKLPVFKKHLDKASYKYTQHPGVTPETITLKVECEFIGDLKPIIAAANKEATK